MDWQIFLENLKREELIIVEGKKDRAALNELGIRNVVVLDKAIYLFCEEIAKSHKRAVILTDLDKEGRRLYSKLKDGVSRFGVSVDDSYRVFLFRHTELRQIEGIGNYLQSFIN